MRFLAVSVLTILFTLTITSCGGSPSSNPKAPTASGASPSPAPAPAPPPAGATVLDKLENTRTWLTCGNCANTLAAGATAKASFTPGIATPSEDGASTQFSISPTAPYSNAYWWLEHAPIRNQINALTYEFDLYIPAGMENLSQAIEFECQQIIGGWVYNFGWQAQYGANIWRIFDYGLKRWDATPIPFTPFTPGTWHHIVSEFHNDLATHTVSHDALTVDGVRHTVGITHNAFHSGSFDKFTNAVQLDSNNRAQPYSIYVDRMRITYH